LALEGRRDRAGAAEPQVVAAEAPRPDDRPRHVLRRIAEVRELPVEQVREPALRDHDVPEPEIAVEDDARQRLGRTLAQPREAVLDRRMRLPNRVELGLEARQDVAAGQERESLGRDRVDLRELLRQLHLEARGRVPDDPAADRLSFHAFHRKRLAAAELA